MDIAVLLNSQTQNAPANSRRRYQTNFNSCPVLTIGCNRQPEIGSVSKYIVQLITSTDEILFTLTLTMTTAQVVETSVTVNNSPIPVHPDDHTQPTYEMTPGFKPFTHSLK